MTFTRVSLLLLLLGLLIVPFCTADNVDAAKQKAGDSAAAAQDNAKSWGEWAKDRLNVVYKDSAESADSANDAGSQAADVAGTKAKEATDEATDTASSTASVYWKAVGSRFKAVTDSINKYSQGATEAGKAKVEAVKSSSNDAASKAYQTVGDLKNKAFGSAESASGKTQESAADAAGKSQGAFEVTKEKLNEQYKAASEALNEQYKAASKMASDVGEKVKNMATGKKDEL